MIADDIVYFRTLLRYSLDPERFEVVAEAGDGAEAVAAARRETPDAMILDLSMPVMDGLEAIPEIRKQSPGTKILVLSSLEASAMEEQALSLGAHAYLEKGIDVGEINDALAAICEEPG